MKITFIFILLSSIVLGQPAEIARRWQLGINYAPEVAFRDHRPFSKEDDNLTKDNFYKWDHAIYGYTTSVNVSYQWKHVGLESGVQLSQMGYERKLPQYGPGTYYNATSTSYEHFFHYLSIPLKVNFMMGKKKLRFITSGSFSFAYLVSRGGQKTETFADGEKITPVKTNLKYEPRINLFTAISAGIEYRFSSVFSLRIEPVFRYGHFRFGTEDNQYHYRGFKWNAGINAGCYFAFK